MTKPLAIIASLFLMLVGVTGCSSGTELQASDGSTASGNSPIFSGPYAADFLRAYEATTDEAIKEYLRDGVISEAEAQSVLENFRSCLAGAGMTLDYYDERGVSITGDPSKIPDSQIQEESEKCSQASGEALILSLYEIVKRDPGGEITPESVVDCYKRSRLVPEDFSVIEYQNGGLQNLYPRDLLYSPSGAEDLSKMTACDDDPVNSFPR